MLDWLAARFRRTPAPLTGAPAVARQKTYAAESGYVYLYHYLGRRENRAATEYVFLVSSGPDQRFEVSIFLGWRAVRPWQNQHGRTLASNERYGIAKLALFQAFDEPPHPAGIRRRVRLGPADVESILEKLGIE